MKTIMHTIRGAPLPQSEPSFRMQQLQHEQEEATPTEKRFAKALHWMRCPKCGHALRTEHNGSVEVAYCPDCQGVWLDSTAFDSIVAPDNDFLRSCLRSFHSEL